MQNVGLFGSLPSYLNRVPSVHLTDVFEILIIAFMIYQVLAWIRATRGWNMLKGISIILGFLAVARIFQMKTILWIASNVFSIAIMAIVVILQPELRKALETLGRTTFLNYIFSVKDEVETLSEKSVHEIALACIEMAKVKTGALIVVQNKQDLGEYVQTGIDLGAVISSQVLINIFEKNTPLHDGAIIIQRDRIVSATCYLPLSENMGLSKDLGTRHRAAVGISEITDCLVVIVSEETGAISVSQEGKIYRNLDKDGLERRLFALRFKSAEAEEKSKRKKAKKNNKNRSNQQVEQTGAAN